MEKWICKVCGYTHHGVEAPDSCPQCGANKTLFHKEKDEHGCAYNIVFAVILLSAAAYAILSCTSPVSVDNPMADSTCFDKYLGKWYEVAYFDSALYDDGRQGVAIYSLLPNGRITVIDEGVRDGEWRLQVGKVKLTDDPGVLSVSFFGPFYYDYRIVMFSPDNSHAFVGSDSTHLRILSRSPRVKKGVHELLVREATTRGYDTDKLIWVEP